MAEQNAPETTQEVIEGEGQEPTPENTDVQVTPEDGTQTFERSYVEQLRKEAATERLAKKEARQELQRIQSEAQEAEEKRKREAMSQAEQLEADAKKAREELQQEREKANQYSEELKSLRVRGEATSKALNLGAKQERLEAVLRLSDFSQATDEDGQPDAKAIESAIKATLKDYPEFKRTSDNLGGPSNPPSDPPNGSKSVVNMTDEEIARASEQAQWGERVTFP